MPYKDPERRRQASRESGRRYKARLHEERYGPGAGDMRGRHGNHARGERNVNWNGGRTVSAHGYNRLYRPDHPAADPNGWVYEHRLVMESRIGRFLTAAEVVHHRNGDKRDNRIENLELTTASEHMRGHARSSRLAPLVLAHIAEHPGATHADVESALGASAAARLSTLTARGLLTRQRVPGRTLIGVVWAYSLPLVRGRVRAEFPEAGSS